MRRRIRAEGEVFAWLGVWDAQPVAGGSGLPAPALLLLGRPVQPPPTRMLSRHRSSDSSLLLVALPAFLGH